MYDENNNIVATVAVAVVIEIAVRWFVAVMRIFLVERIFKICVNIAPKSTDTCHSFHLTRSLDDLNVTFGRRSRKIEFLFISNFEHTPNIRFNRNDRIWALVFGTDDNANDFELHFSMQMCRCLCSVVFTLRFCPI